MTLKNLRTCVTIRIHAVVLVRNGYVRILICIAASTITNQLPTGYVYAKIEYYTSLSCYVR